MDEDFEIKEENNSKKEPICPRCGLRSYNEICQVCGTPIVNKKETEEDDEEYDNWREKYR